MLGESQTARKTAGFPSLVHLRPIKNMETLSGYISYIIFRNDDNGYTVFELTDKGETFVCVGYLRDVSEGEPIELYGEFTEHISYGEQFAVKSYEVKVPGDEEAMIRYLGSGAVKGIGPALAERIVRRFGKDTFKIIEEQPERLAEIKGISARKARDIAVQIMEKQELRRAMLFLQKYGIGGTLSVKIYKRYGESLYKVLSENPYRLAEDIEGIGFKKADELAARIGVRPDSEHRIRCGALFALREAFSEGHCYLPKEALIGRAEELLGVAGEAIWHEIKNLAMDRKIVIKECGGEICIYESFFYYSELFCARKLLDLNITFEIDPQRADKKIAAIERSLDITLDEIQRTAVRKAAMNGVTVITGGPGTGKTTIINAIIKYFEDTDSDILLCAPTGRAAKRMSEATGYEASTIQRLLHPTPTREEQSGSDMRDLQGGQTQQAVRFADEGVGFYYAKNEEEPLEADIVIVDEMSMVDISLFAALLRAVVPGTRLILVGDTDQLPSVGPGAVLKDIINSGRFADSTVILRKIFRQAGESDIIVNAHKINDGAHIDLDNKSRDFFFLERKDVNKILNNIVVLVRDKLPKYVGASSFDIQVLTPMKKGALGVESLNPILQKYLNPPSSSKREKEIGDVIFREGDKVMQTKNNYQLVWEIKTKSGIVVDKGEGIFNGDMGIIKEISDFSETVTIEYDGGRKVEYPYDGLEELSLAYAVTIHKSQGSEYPAVIIPLLNGPRLLFYRNLLYTGVTRAVKCVVLLGSRERIDYMIDNADEHRRYTGLSDRLKEV